MKLFDKVESLCEICLRYKQPNLKPIVGFSLSKEFSDVISVDLKQINVTFLHIADNVTRLSKAAVVNSKRQEEIVNTFIRCWIAIFAASGVIISNKCDKFSNSLLVDIAEQLNIVLKGAAVESPWLNGIVERHNAILCKTIKKFVIDSKNKYPIDFIKARAANAKNILHSYYCYSPNQLVVGHNPTLPSFLVNDLSTIEKTSTGLHRKLLNVMYDSRKAFTGESKSNEILCRAI